MAKTITADQFTLSTLNAIAMVPIQRKRLGQQFPATSLQLGEKEEELCAFAYGGWNGISGVVENISQGRLDGINI